VQSISGTAPGVTLHVAPSLVATYYAQYKKRGLAFTSEYERLPFNAILTVGPQVAAIPVDARSWYVMASGRVKKKFQVGSYYSHSVNKYFDTSQPANYSKDFVLSSRCDFNSYFYGKIEGHFLHGTGLGYYASTNPGGLKPNSNMLAAKIGFSF